MTPNAAARYQTLLDKIAEFWDRAVSAQPTALRCRPGCTACCAVDLTVWPVEAAALRAHLSQLPEATRHEVAQRAARPSDGRCVFLHEDRCLVYAARPVICRTHGLALRVDDRIDHCPENFRDEPPLATSVLALSNLDTTLALVNRLWLTEQGAPDDAPRVALRTLAAGG